METMWAPGAMMSGLDSPSCVWPLLDQSTTVSSLRVSVALSSTAPTDITHGSLPGAWSPASGALPRLPAAGVLLAAPRRGAGVAGARHDEDPVEVRRFGGCVERVGPVGLGGRRLQ